MRTKWGLVALIVVGGLLGAGTEAFAHHGSRVSYDMGKMVTLKGTVAEFDYVNPHCYFLFDVKDDKGVVTRWAAETDPPLMMNRRYGWNRNYLKVGDEVTVTVWPSKAGAPRGFLAKVTTADGKVTDHSGELPPEQAGQR